MTAQAGGTLVSEAAAQKAALRREARRVRSALPRNNRIAAADRAAQALLRQLPRRCSIAIYLSVHSELSTVSLRRLLHEAGHRVHVPVILRERRMRFVELHGGSPLRSGPYGLPQPVMTRGLKTARQLDVILLPLLAFDAHGGRLGNGGGYYDRALARPRIGRRPRLIGYAYAAQEREALPCEPWDVRLDAVISERGLKTFPKPTPERP